MTNIPPDEHLRTARTPNVRRANLRRAVVTALVVGPILTLINQTPVLAAMLSGDPVPPIALLRIALTFLVPFAVSLVSASLASRSARR